ncbi:MAG: serine protease [Candidatus Bipolaricaulota bacterium]|nr:serine protease [Candidatus Bipolaricaulota bacterium]MDW8127494.1 serine protease [Candidatus Bipolaricaulota bacterium]
MKGIGVRIFLVLVMVTLLGVGIARNYSTAQISQTAGPGSSSYGEAQIQKFIRSVTVQVLIQMEKYTRPLMWYQEVTATGERGEWKARYGDWSKTPTPVVQSGTGVIVYSCDGGQYSGTFILTNAHVVQPLVQSSILGSPYSPIDEYRLDDLIIETMPPSVKPKPEARPFQQYYFKIPSNYVQIKSKEDQFYTVYAKIVDYDLALDVALLQVCKPDGTPAAVWGLPYASFRDFDPMLGESVWVCGCPLGIPFSIDRGRVNQVNLDLGTGGGIVWNKQVKIDIAAAPGNSGSGIFDDRGYICALLHGTLIYAGNYIRGGILAIPVTLIRDWLTWRGWAFIVSAPPHVSAPYYKPAG